VRLDDGSRITPLTRLSGMTRRVGCIGAREAKAQRMFHVKHAKA
jgi:hypothetical protein